MEARIRGLAVGGSDGSKRKVLRKDEGDALRLVQVAHQKVTCMLEELTDLTARALARHATLLEEIGAEIHARIDGEICYPDAVEVRSDEHLRQIDEALGKLRDIEVQATDLEPRIDPAPAQRDVALLRDLPAA